MKGSTSKLFLLSLSLNGSSKVPLLLGSATNILQRNSTASVDKCLGSAYSHFAMSLYVVSTEPESRVGHWIFRNGKVVDQKIKHELEIEPNRKPFYPIMIIWQQTAAEMVRNKFLL